MIKIGDRVKISNYKPICTVLGVNGNDITVFGDGVKLICDVNNIDYVSTNVVYNFNDLYLKQLVITEKAKRAAGLSEIPIDDVMMWLLAEAGEALNEAKFFKYCRNKDVDREKLVEELVDCLFMFLELSILTDFTNIEHAKSFQDKSGCNLTDAVDDIELEFTYLISEISLAVRMYKRGSDDYKRKLYDALNTYVGILHYYGISNNEVHNMYYKKAKINECRLQQL